MSKYDKHQHRLICQLLSCSDDPNAPGPTAFEAVASLQAKYEALDQFITGGRPPEPPAPGATVHNNPLVWKDGFWTPISDDKAVIMTAGRVRCTDFSDGTRMVQERYYRELVVRLPSGSMVSSSNPFPDHGKPY